MGLVTAILQRWLLRLHGVGGWKYHSGSHLKVLFEINRGKSELYCWLYQIQTLATSFSCVPDIASFHPWPYAAAKGARLAQSLAAAHQENQVVLCK